MIKPVNSFNQSNNVSFNSMYGLGKDWNVKYTERKEREFLQGLLKDIQNKTVKYIKNDGIVYSFENYGDDIFYIRGKDNIMSNIKCVSRADDSIGYYAVDDSLDFLTRSIYHKVEAALSALVKRK